MRVAVFGAGYVGLVTGVALAYLGHQVDLVEIDPHKVEQLERGQSPIFEAGLDTLLPRLRERDQVRVGSDGIRAAQSADVIFIAVGTPPLESGQADLGYVRQAAGDIGAALDGTQRHVVVNKATVPIGSGNLVEVWIEEGYQATHGGERPPQGSYAVASNPEFLREGSALGDTLYPDRIVVGTDDPWALETLRELYAPIVEQNFVPPEEVPRPDAVAAVPLVETDRVSAEMIKYAANAFLATKISFANEMANICERVGADVGAVTRGMGLDQRIGSRFLQAGVGWGGSCFGKDVAALIFTAREYGYEPELLQSTVTVNRRQRLWAVSRVQEALRPAQGRRVALWGLAFKPGTDDLRDAPALTVIHELLKLGVRLSAYDPVAMGNFRRQYPDSPVSLTGSALECATDAELVLLLTEWAEFRDVPLDRLAAVMRPGETRWLIDGRNVLNPQEALRAGLVYRGLGRPPTITP